MLKITSTNKFKKDYSLAIKRSLKIDLLDEVIVMLAKEIALPGKYQEHKLTGEYEGCTECHIKPDWLLVYYYENDTIVFYRTGSHSDLF